MILKQKALPKLVQNMKPMENQKRKNATSRYRNHITKTQCARSEKVHRQTHSTTEPSSVLTCTVQVNQTSCLHQNNDEKFCKIT